MAQIFGNGSPEKGKGLCVTCCTYYS